MRNSLIWACTSALWALSAVTNSGSFLGAISVAFAVFAGIFSVHLCIREAVDA